MVDIFWTICAQRLIQLFDNLLIIQQTVKLVCYRVCSQFYHYQSDELLYMNSHIKNYCILYCILICNVVSYCLFGAIITFSVINCTAGSQPNHYFQSALNEIQLNGSYNDIKLEYHLQQLRVHWKLLCVSLFFQLLLTCSFLSIYSKIKNKSWKIATVKTQLIQNFTNFTILVQLLMNGTISGYNICFVAILNNYANNNLRKYGDLLESALGLSISLLALHLLMLLLSYCMEYRMLDSFFENASMEQDSQSQSTRERRLTIQLIQKHQINQATKFISSAILRKRCFPKQNSKIMFRKPSLKQKLERRQLTQFPEFFEPENYRSMTIELKRQFAQLRPESIRLKKNLRIHIEQ